MLSAYDKPLLEYTVYNTWSCLDHNGEVAQLVERRTGTPPGQVRIDSPVRQGIFLQSQLSVQTI